MKENKEIKIKIYENILRELLSLILYNMNKLVIKPILTDV